MTHPTALILQALASGRGYGFDIMDVTGLPSGTVYPALRRLERTGHLRARWEPEERAVEEGRPRRRLYALTPAGEAAAREARTHLEGILRVLPGRLEAQADGAEGGG